MLAPVLLLMRDDPAEIGLEPYGGAAAPAVAVRRRRLAAVMRRAMRTPEFWLLAGSFFICGATSNGLVGAHFIPHALDHGIPTDHGRRRAGAHGRMNFVGTIGSGWLTDRFDPRKLLALYYGFRGLSLAAAAASSPDLPA